jgi:hypothetical protein
MKTVIIKSITDKNINKIQLIHVFVKYNSTLGLRKAKDFVDLLSEKQIPVEYSIDDEKLVDFTRELSEMKLDFDVRN